MAYLKVHSIFTQHTLWLKLFSGVALTNDFMSILLFCQYFGSTLPPENHVMDIVIALIKCKLILINALVIVSLQNIRTHAQFVVAVLIYMFTPRPQLSSLDIVLKFYNAHMFCDIFVL